MKSKSFTLIELLVVIVIIGILAGVIMISTSSSIDKANITKSKVFEESVKNSILVNLISEWDLNGEGAVTVESITDSWGNNNAQSISGDPQFKNDSECVNDTCIEFDGVGDFINLGSPQDFKNIFTTKDWTISIWAKPGLRALNENGGEIFSRTGGSFLLLRMRGTTSPYFYLYVKDINSVSITTATTSIPLNKWAFIVAERHGDNLLVYINGELKTSKPLPENFDITSETGNAFIGQACCSTNNYTGTLDDIKLYDLALSASKIKQNYIAGLDSLLSKESISKEDYNQKINELAYEK
jgi:prepilin-type N-terminal cleavage/methylation domain-containing protein